MKHGKNPTVSEKRIMQSWGLIVDNWLVSSTQQSSFWWFTVLAAKRGPFP